MMNATQPGTDHMLLSLKGGGCHGYAQKKNRDFLFYATVMFVRQNLLGENLSAAACLRKQASWNHSSSRP